MSREQLESLDAMLRERDVEPGADLAIQRAAFEEMMSRLPLPTDVRTASTVLGNTPVVDITIDGLETDAVIFYLHGGAFAIGTAALAAGLASDIARRSASRVVSIEYRLAPEHPYPAAIDDAIDAYRGLLATGVPASSIVFAGESAGGGVVASTLVAIKMTDLPQPAAAYVISPWVDLSLTGESLQGNASLDPSLTADGLRRRALDYLAGHGAADGAISPIFADLSGLPPLLIQVGGHEILLDDATRLAARAATDGVAVTLEVTPGAPHVFPVFAAMLEEGDAALESAGRFIRRHLA